MFVQDSGVKVFLPCHNDAIGASTSFREGISHLVLHDFDSSLLLN